MNFSALQIMVRSAFFELKNETCYFAPVPYNVSVDGSIVLENQTTNNFSLYGLEPDHDYQISVSDGSEAASITIHTKAESYYVDATRYGLVADGATDNTPYLQAALSTCPAGGTVYIPAGTYCTQSLFLRSETTLYLEKGCTLLGGTDRKKYPILPGVLPSANEESEHYLASWEGNPLDSFAALINIINAHDVTITGEGKIDANADKGDWYQDPKTKKIAWRPRLFFTNGSKNVILHGVDICNSYSWTIHPTYSENVNILHLHIHNHADSPNTDGIDPESCNGVNIIGDYVHVGDDCIALKSGKLFLGMHNCTPCRNVVIRNCNLNRGHGGLVIGSEMSGGMQNISVSQVLMDNTDRGLRVKTRRGRGKNAIIDGLSFNNVEMKHVLTPFVINMFYCCDPDGYSDYVQSRDPLPVDDMTPRLYGLKIENVTATDAEFAGCWFSGLPEQPIDSVEMNHVSISFAADAKVGMPAMTCGIEPCGKLAFLAENVQHVHLHDVTLTGYEGERLLLNNVPDFKED